ncbi:MAG: nitroreductase family protein [Thermoguttaceae bacterium]|nr:nitroreductase family protein [Thermoguttaceae bacterium]
MDFAELAKARYSVRNFKSIPVESELLNKVLEAARLAPTACNNQPQKIIVAESADALDRLKRCTQYHFNAPMALIVCYDKNVSWKRPFDGKDNGSYDACIVTTHLILQAADLGLGTTWVGYFDPKDVVREFKLPANIVPVAILPLGYPAANAKPAAGHSQRNPLNSMVVRNSF